MGQATSHQPARPKTSPQDTTPDVADYSTGTKKAKGSIQIKSNHDRCLGDGTFLDCNDIS